MKYFKNILFFIIIFLFFSACNNEKNGESPTANMVDSATTPVITFTEEKHDFGTIQQGEKVSYSFIFKNTGSSDLVISSASGSCGCTVPTYPKEPVKPGQESKIDVVFDSDGKSGLVEKTVTLNTNCIPSVKTLTITSNIIVP